MFYKWLIGYLLIINAAGFLCMLADKRRAQKNLWRIPEATLLTVAALGGSAGALAGMRLAHHKTRKPKFSVGVPLLLAVHILCAVIYIIYTLAPNGQP